MYCQKCGHEMLESSKFCKDCGFGVSGVVGNEKFTASALIRLANYFIDRILGAIIFCTFFVALWGLVSVFASSGIISPQNIFVKIFNVIIPILIVISIYINPFYFLFFEGIWGRSIGKWITKTKVVRKDGGKPRFMQVLGRSFARFIPFEAFSFLVSNNPVGWHDSLSNTLVVPADYTPDDVKNINFNGNKKQKNALVIVAIIVGILFFISVIGILSSVVLASLNSARAKGQDASTKANLDNVKAEAELYWNSQSMNGKDGSYSGLCNSDVLIQTKNSLAKVNDSSPVCNDNLDGYVIASPLNSGGYWCVDSSGQSITIDNTLGDQLSCSSVAKDTTTEETIRTSFMNSCTGKSATSAYCSCVFDGLIEKIGVDGFIEMSNNYDKTGKMESEVTDTISGCSYLSK